MMPQKQGQIITFYSYKGGTGRTMALANLAVILSKKYSGSKNILMIDWDLDAPGLHQYFRSNIPVDREGGFEIFLQEKPGLIELFTELEKATGQSEFQSVQKAEELFRQMNFKRFVTETNISSLHLLKAGCIDRKYSYRVNTFKWEELFKSVPWLFLKFANYLTSQYDYVLIDSRTGVTDISGICTMLMPEKLVTVFTPNYQSLEGITQIIRRSTDYRRQSDDLRPLVVFPLASRVEMSERDLKILWRFNDNPDKGAIGYQPKFEKLFKEIYELPECNLTKYFDEVLIQHFPYYSYGEEIAALEEDVSDRLSFARSYENIAECLLKTDVPWEAYSFPKPGLKGKRKKIFISYSHADTEWLLKVRKHLSVLGDNAVNLDVWDDTQIKAGMKWKEEISKALNEAKIAVLLISTDFLASDFILKDELPPLLKAAEHDGATILPLILMPSMFTKIENLSQFQAVNDPEREPLASLNEGEQEKILVELTNTIYHILLSKPDIKDANIQFISELCDSEDKVLREIGSHFKSIFYVGDRSPFEELLNRDEDIKGDMEKWFPSGFSERYRTWQQKEVGLRLALDRGVYEDVEQIFIDIFSGLKDTWKMLLDFLPFLFMLSVNRMDKNCISDIGKEEFKQAFSIYRKVFHENSGDDIEKEKSKLTIYLLQLFRKLSEANKISDEFILWPLLGGGKNFDRLFPLRFDSIISLFSQLDREAIEHILRKQDSNALKDIFFLSKWGMLDITNMLIPIFKSFFLVYISKINLEEKPYLTEGISISGFGDTNDVAFRLLPGPRSDSTSLQESNLYLINRKKQIGFHEFRTESEEVLTPYDYMNLTPLMLYTTFKEMGEPGEKRPHETEATDRKELFVFQGYESSSDRPEQKFLKFLEFSGIRVAQIVKSKKSQFYKLFEEYESFARNLTDYYIDIEKLLKKVALEQNIDKSENVEFVFHKTWNLSLGHISSLLRIDEYDSDASLIETVEKRNEKVKFIEKLFVSPKEEKFLEEFLQSDKRGLIIIGKSGMGKSNLLCAGFLKQRRKYELNIFIDARKLDSIDIKDSLKKSIAWRIHEDWGLKEFDDFLQSNQKGITVFIDAVNEYNNVGGALKLLEKICDLVEDVNIFKNIKIIASCRNETWDQYKKKIGYTENVLNGKYFFTQSGDAVNLSGFEEGRERELLYSSYQTYYRLSPESYQELSPAVRELIKQPFMMGFIAEIYTNRYEDSPASANAPKPNTIPKTLDYFILFEYLTEKKKEDAKRLLAEVSNRDDENFENSFKDCLFWFARILYDKIVEPGTGNDIPGASQDKSDSLKIDQLNKNQNFNRFFNRLNPYDDTSIFTAVIQVGLLERIYVDEYDYWGNKKSGRAYKFFHDQYTQYWLSAVFNKDILGRIDSSTIKAHPNWLDTLVDKIEFILEASQNATVLSGALYHWLYNNVFDKKKNPNEYFSILFNRLAAKESNNIDYFVGSFLHWLIEADIISAEKLNNELVLKGDIRLRKCFHQHIPYVWPRIALSTLQIILAEEREDDLIKSLGDIFVNLFTLETAEEVIAFLDKALLSYESFKDVAKRVFEISKLKRDSLFMFIFIIQSFLCNFTDPKRLIIIRNFLKKKYNWVFNLLANKEARGVNKAIRGVIINTIKTAGIHQWQQAVSSQGRNDKFFEEDEEIVQKDVLRDFYKYCAALHNGNREIFSLERDSEYMTMTFKMMEYQNRSVIGYVASLILVGVLRDHIERLDEIIDEIIKLKSQPALSYGISVVHMLAKLDPHTVDHSLDIIHKKFLPVMINNLEKDEYAMASVFIIGAIDFDQHWEKCEIIFSDIITHLHKKGDKIYIDTFGKLLVESVFPPEIRIGIGLCDYMVKKKLHEDPLWRDFTFTLLAAMLARSPKTLDRILDDNMIPDTIINDIRPFLTEDIIEFVRKVSYKHSWNNLLVLGFLENKQVSYLLIKFLLYHLVQTRNLEEAAKITPGLVVEAIQRFIMDDTDNKSHDEDLTVDEAL